MKEVKVSVFKRKGQSIFYMQYRDPETENKIRRSTGKKTKRDAEREAAKWEREILEGLDDRRFGRLPWEEFRRLYEEQVLSSLAEGTDHKATGIFNVLERVIRPKRLLDVNEDTLSRYQTWLRKNGRTESTIKAHLAHIRAALSWARDRKLIFEVPKVKMPKRARKSKVMKGRAISLEEFERMLSKIETVLFPPGVKLCDEKKPVIVDSWAYHLNGLWLSGLRLEESMELDWTDRSRLCVEDLDARHPMLWVPGEFEKGNEDRVLPMAPEFAEFLRQTASEERAGYVFNPLPRRHRYGSRISAHHVSKVISRIGEAANVKVNENPTTGKLKFASSHDLRRSFGERWASRVMPNVLQELMRHENIQTTMRYYVGQNAKRTSSILWDVHRSLGTTLGASHKTNQESLVESPSVGEA